jgi:hypothetical protein
MVASEDRSMTTAIAPSPHERLYRGRVGQPQLVDVPPARFLMVDGHGDPNTAPAYAAAIQSLYSVAYTLKFACKRNGLDIGRVPPLEGLWFGAEDANFEASTKDRWSWTMMLRISDAAPETAIDEAKAAAAAKRPDLPIGDVRVEQLAEGRAAQVLYRGPYSDEGPMVAALHAFIADQHLDRRGAHHEIYLGDPRRAAPETLRTIIRQPVA